MMSTSDNMPLFGFSQRQWFIIVIGCIILCGCRGVDSAGRRLPGHSSARTQYLHDNLMGSHATAHGENPLDSPRRLPPVTTYTHEAMVQYSVAPSETNVHPIAPATAVAEESVPPQSSGEPSKSASEQHAPFLASPPAVPPEAHEVPHMQLPPSAWGGDPGAYYPEDEYIVDGGDQLRAVIVEADGTVRGIDPQDTVAYYDAPGLRKNVVASNPVAIYAPRFAAVRQVSGVLMAAGVEGSMDTQQETTVAVRRRQEGAQTAVQPLATERHQQAELVYGFRSRELPLGVDNSQVLHDLNGDWLPYENFAVIRTGTYDNTEKARLASGIVAAKTWTHDGALQVMLGGHIACEAASGNSAEETARYEMPPGKPRLRLVKVASCADAEPGTTVHFTLRFDNIGDEVLDNVTILDRLAPRLEYVPDSAQCSFPAEFSRHSVDEGTTVLRWELKEALRVGQGGVIRFQCLVR